MNPLHHRSTLIALIGRGVSPSLTPRMHELEGARHGMRYVYRTVEFDGGADPVSELRRLITAAEAFGFDGLNLTYPVKQTVLPLLQDLSTPARMVGAVNTVVWDHGQLIGHNTDVSGFGASMRDALGEDPLGDVVLLGAGGAGSAVSHALAMRGAELLTIVDVDLARARQVAEDLQKTHTQQVAVAPPADVAQLLGRADGLVNATPIGMAHHPGSPISLELLHPGLWVCDVVYRPVETQLLTAARAAGCQTIPGLGMAMHQAADAFEIFTGESADRRAMLHDLRVLVEAENDTPATHRGKVER